MYSIVLMMALSGGADAVECGRHGSNSCVGGAPVAGCVGSAPVVAAPVVVGCSGGAGCVGSSCHGGHGGLFRGGLFHRNSCNGGTGCDGCTGGHGGLFKGGLFHRNRGGCNGCVGGAPVVVPACSGCSASLSGGAVTVAQLGAPVVANRQAAILVARN